MMVVVVMVMMTMVLMLDGRHAGHDADHHGRRRAQGLPCAGQWQAGEGGRGHMAVMVLVVLRLIINGGGFAWWLACLS